MALARDLLDEIINVKPMMIKIKPNGIGSGKIMRPEMIKNQCDKPHDKHFGRGLKTN